MSQIYNFSAGPSALPSSVLKKIQSELLEFRGAKASVMEISHRGVDFMELTKKAKKNLRNIMNIPNREILNISKPIRFAITTDINPTVARALKDCFL